MDTAKPLPAPVVYPETDDMGEHELQRYIAELLRPLLERWLGEQRRVAHAGADQFFYWVQGDPGRRRAPDVYVIDGVAQDIPEVASWKTWEGHCPTFALEIVGDDWKKDYEEAPADYGALGTRELVVFDPWATGRSKKRLRWQVWRRVARRGLVRVEATQGDRVESRALGCWLRAVAERGHTRLRLATGPQGEALVPTEGERLAQEAAAAQVARAQAASAEVKAQSAEAEVARLRARLAEIEGGLSGERGR